MPIVISNIHLISIELYVLNLNLVVIIADITKNMVTIPPIFNIVFILLFMAFIKVLPKLLVEIMAEFYSLLLILFFSSIAFLNSFGSSNTLKSYLLSKSKLAVSLISNVLSNHAKYPSEPSHLN